MTVRLKMKCVSKTEPGSDGTISNLRLEPVYTGSEENKKFFKYTPCGQLSFGTINTDAAEELIEGEEYYVDIYRAPKPDDVPL